MSDYRVGLIVPSSNLTMETELPRMLTRREEAYPEQRFIFHASRMRMQHVTREELARMNAQTERAVMELGDARPDVVASACLVAIMAQGNGYHHQAEEEIRHHLSSTSLSIPVVSSAGALLTGLSAIGAKKVSVITPYMKPLTKLVVDYIEDAGIRVNASLSLEVADNLEVARLDPANLIQHARNIDTSEADALVLSACVQMPSLPVVDQVEDELGIPVITAATSTVFSILAALGLETEVPRAGSLLSGRYSAPAS